jgi:small subunit ribosomal protein S12
MITKNQLLKNIRIKKKHKLIRKALQKCPQKKGVCINVSIMTPRKPNSAKRKIARIKLSNHLFITAYIPGKGHSLQQHSTVLIRGGNTKDLPGLKYKIIRGKYDLYGVEHRKRSRSKYGTKKNK